MTLKDFGLLSLEANKFSRNIFTQKDYQGSFDKHIAPYFRDKELSALTRMDFLNWQSILVKQKLSSKRISNIRIILSTILKDAIAEKLITDNFLNSVPKIRVTPTKEILPFSLDEIKLILNNSEGAFKNMFQLAFFTGVRTGELIGLKWEDIDFKNKLIKIKRRVRLGDIDQPKTLKSIRDIDMIDLANDALVSQKKLTYKYKSFIFLNANNEYFKDICNIRKRVWTKVLKNANIPYRPMINSRHTFASIMLSNNEDPLWVSKTLGHSNLHTTLAIYAKFIKQQKVERATFLKKF